MAIKINEKILSIPPYISTHWSRISALHMKGSVLAITLTDGNVISIPGITSDIIESIFNYHAAFLEKTSIDSTLIPQFPTDKNDQLNHLMEQGGAALRLGFGSLEGLGNAMQHNPSQANAPDLPSEILQKISSISKILAADEIALPKAEPSCNCFHCQIARVLNPSPLNEEQSGDAVADEELVFQQWNIAQTGDKLFSVINRLDEREKYSVYLGQPIGCTCGKQGCDHIVAVLKS